GVSAQAAWTTGLSDAAADAVPVNAPVLRDQRRPGNAAISVLAAREAAAGDDQPWETGHADQPYSILVSNESHYCVDRATRIMGWGQKGAWKTPVDERFRIDPTRLQASLQAARNEGRKVLGLVGNACTTATGSFDPLPDLADFCQDNGLWFHVDAAHGGGALFSERHRSLLEGIERADSVVIDFHKMLLTPTLTTGVLFRKEQDSFRAFAQKAEYLWRENESPEWYNPAKRTIECTKPMLGLKVYTLLKAYGTAAFEANIDRLFDLGEALAERLERAPDFDLYQKPFCNIVCYRHRPEGIPETDLNAYNQWLRDRLVQSGRFYIVQIKRGEELFLRSALMNPLTTEDHLDHLLETLREVGGDWPG
ncbi:MAG: pyridoxal-dependent decarboxylase, partial [Verrucomicrobiota bacterium]